MISSKPPFMKTTKLLLLFSICYLISNTKASGQSGWNSKLSNSIDVVIGGDFGFRMITRTSSDPETQQEFENRRNLEKYKLNYRFGFNYYQGITGNLSIKTGLRFANPGFSISDTNLEDLNEDINGIEKKWISEGSEYRYNYHMIEIPLGVKYVISNTYCDPYFEAGLSANVYWKTIVQERFHKGGSESNSISEDINRVNWIGFVASGGTFDISRKISGFIQLMARCQINNLRSGDLNERIISLGLEAGGRYYL